jgi:hypothetical protein
LKDKATRAIKTGKEKVAGFFGDIAGRLAWTITWQKKKLMVG